MTHKRPFSGAARNRSERRGLELSCRSYAVCATDLTLRADYTSSHIRNPVASFPTVTPEIEAAFPERFVRDAAGDLVSIEPQGPGRSGPGFLSPAVWAHDQGEWHRLPERRLAKLWARGYGCRA